MWKAKKCGREKLEIMPRNLVIGWERFLQTLKYNFIKVVKAGARI